MKRVKTIFILLIISAFVFQFVSAVEFNVNSEYKQGETIIASISGNFLDQITKSNIEFYRGHVKIPMDYDVIKIENKFYLYASLVGKTPNNYSIVIKDVEYMKGAEVVDDEIQANFSITEEIADFSVMPGFIYTNDDFYLEVQDLQDFEIEINVKSSAEDYSFNLISGETEKINFDIGNLSIGFQTIELSTNNLNYAIPVYLSLNETPEDEKEKSFRFEPDELDFTMSTNSETTRIVYLYNDGEETIENITLSIPDSLEDYLSVSITQIDELEENESVKIEFDFISDDEENQIYGEIKAEGDGLKTYLSVYLNFLKDYIPSENDTSVPTDPAKIKIKTCEELGGEICEDDEECNVEVKNAKDGNCCLGKCEKIEKSSTGKIIGWGLIIIIISFLFWFFKVKYKRTRKKNINLVDVAKGRR